MLSCTQYGGDPTLGNVYILQSIAAVVVGGTALTGGTGGPVNTLIGALILGVMENGMNVVGVDAYSADYTDYADCGYWTNSARYIKTSSVLPRFL